MNKEEREKFIEDMYNKAIKSPRFMKMRWFNWNNNYELRELFNKCIGVKRDNPIIRSKAKVWGDSEYITWMVHKDMSY
jgi:hypothetical protein